MTDIYRCSECGGHSGAHFLSCERTELRHHRELAAATARAEAAEAALESANGFVSQFAALVSRSEAAEVKIRRVEEVVERGHYPVGANFLIDAVRAALAGANETPGGAPNLPPLSRPTCKVCMDTHRMPLQERTVPCSRCPIPCAACRHDRIPYCHTTPCGCACHHARKALLAALAEVRQEIVEGGEVDARWEAVAVALDELIPPPPREPEGKP